MGHAPWVVVPCYASPWFLRMIGTLRFHFLGLHWASSNAVRAFFKEVTGEHGMLSAFDYG
jgi:hypothetical protein